MTPTVAALRGMASLDRRSDMPRLAGQWSSENLDAIARELYGVTAAAALVLGMDDRRRDWRQNRGTAAAAAAAGGAA